MSSYIYIFMYVCIYIYVCIICMYPKYRMHVCYIYMVTFTINRPPVLAYIPYMDPVCMYVCTYVCMYVCV